MITSVFKKFSRVMILVGIAFIVRPALAGDQPAQLQPPQPDPVVAGLVNQLQFGQDDHDRQKAAKELGKIADPGTLPVLAQAAVYDDASSVRKDARKSALHVSGNVPPRQGLVFPQDNIGSLMAQLLDGHKDGDRENAARQLGAIAHPASLPALEIAAVFDSDGGVRDAARKAAVTVRKVLAARAEQEQMNRSESAGASDSAAPAVQAAPVAQATEVAPVMPVAPAAPSANVMLPPAAPTTPQPGSYPVPASPTVVAVPTAPQTVVVPPPTYYYPAPPVYYYYPRPAYYYPGSAYYYPRSAYYYPAPAYYGPRVSIGLGFGFGSFGHYHHR